MTVFNQAQRDSRREEVVLIQLQVIVVPKPSQHRPRGFVAASLDEQGVEEEEAFAETSEESCSRMCTHMHRHTRTLVQNLVTGRPSPRTFQGEPVVAHAVVQILPHHIFHVLQRLRFQRGVETRPLTTVRNKDGERRHNLQTAPLVSNLILARLWRFYLEEVELIIVKDPVIIQV